MVDASASVDALATGELLKSGIIGLICIVFAVVIKFLYKEGKEERKASESERKIWNAEREALKADNAKCIEACKTEKEAMRADSERRYREVLEGYTHQLVLEREAGRKREDGIRQETDDAIEKVFDQQRASSDAIAEMLQKLLEKIVK